MYSASVKLDLLVFFYSSGWLGWTDLPGYPCLSDLSVKCPSAKHVSHSHDFESWRLHQVYSWLQLAQASSLLD